MKRNVLCLLAVLALLLTGSTAARTGHGDQGGNALTSEEYSVYSAILASRLSRAPAKLVVVADRTVQAKHFDDEMAGPGAAAFAKSFIGLNRETVADYLIKNESVAVIERELSLPVTYSLITDAELKSIFQKGLSGWDVFNSKYPDSTGLIRFSRVGFNSTGDQAFLYVARTCGGLCGTGDYVFLIKSSDGWQIQKQLMLWVS